MNKTLIDATQRVLAKLKLEPVNSITDSEDATDIAIEAENTFYDLLSRDDWKRQRDVLRLEAYSHLDSPAFLVIPEHVGHIDELRLDTTDPNTVDQTGVQTTVIEYLDPSEFRKLCDTRNTSLEDIEVVEYNGYPFAIHNNVEPTYWTSIDDKILIFDAFPQNKIDTLVPRYAYVEAQIQPVWDMSDDYVIELPDQMYPLFIAELTSACAMYLNEEVSQEDERRRNRGISTMRRKAIKTGSQYKRECTYGRTGNGLS